MRDGSAAGCVLTCEAPDVEMETKGRKMILRWKAIPWARVIVDTLLLAGLLAASSSVLVQR